MERRQEHGVCIPLYKRYDTSIACDVLVASCEVLFEFFSRRSQAISEEELLARGRIRGTW